MREPHDTTTARASTVMSKFESCKHFVKGLFSKGMDTIETAVAAETQVLFDDGAISDAMNVYKAKCPVGKDPFHPSTVFEYVNKPIKAKELGRIVDAALESAGGAALTQGAEPLGTR